MGEVVGKPSLASLSSVVGLLAGISSLAGAGYSAVRWFRPADSGEIVAVVREAGSARTVHDASIEVLTPEDRLVTTLVLDSDGRARQSLREGAYRVRVSHPDFAPASRAVEVTAGETAEVPFRLTHATQRRTARPSLADEAARAANKGVSATRRFLRGFGL